VSTGRRLGYSVDDAAKAVDLNRTTLYSAMRAGELQFAKVGKRTLIPVAALEAWLAAKCQRAQLAAPRGAGAKRHGA